MQQRAQRFLWRLHSADREKFFSAIQLLLDWESEPKVVMKYWAQTRADQTARKEAVFNLLETFRKDTVGPFLQQWRASIYLVSVRFLTLVRAQCADERQRRGLLNFNDILLLTARLLRRRSCAKLQTRYRWLFVDEFQDTDPLQAELLFELASQPGQSEPDWSRLELRPGALFIVGDPKQSIYRFRRADIEIYNLVRERIVAGGGAEIALKSSFRSRAGICNWMNRVFSELFPQQSTSGQAHFSPLLPLESSRGGEIRTLTIETARPYDAAAAESVILADWVSAQVAGGDYRWGDFLILTWRKADLVHYAREFELRKVPVEVTGAAARSDFWVPTLLELLSSLADPGREVSVVGVLRGPLFGIDDDTLYRHRRAGGRFSLFSGTGEAAVSAALASLSQMRDWVRRWPPGAAIEKILE